MEEYLKLHNAFLKEQENNRHREEQDNKCYLALIGYVLNLI
jgi:hypothetical protein